MCEATPVPIPADPNSTLVKESEENSYNIQFPYREAVWSLMYAATISGPDISYSVEEVSRF